MHSSSNLSSLAALRSLLILGRGSLGSLKNVGDVTGGGPMGLLRNFKQPLSTVPQPPSSADTGRFVASAPQINILRILVQNNADDDTIAAYLRTLISLQASGYRQQQQLEGVARHREAQLEEVARHREAQLEEVARHRAEILRLQGDLEVTKAQYSGEVRLLTEHLQYTMGEYLRLMGMLSMRGIMEYTQFTMLQRTDVIWRRSQPAACWQAYVDQRPSLQQCLLKRRLAVHTAGQDLVEVYNRLSEDVHNSSPTPTMYQKYSSAVYIGAPLVQQKHCELIACLCEDMHVAYQMVPLVPATPPHGVTAKTKPNEA